MRRFLQTKDKKQNKTKQSCELLENNARIYILISERILEDYFYFLLNFVRKLVDYNIFG